MNSDNFETSHLAKGLRFVQSWIKYPCKNVYTKLKYLNKPEPSSNTVNCNLFSMLELALTVCSWFSQPKPKSPWNFSLLYYRYVLDRSESVEKNICHQASKTVILKKQIFHTKTCSFMAFFSHVYSSEIWKPDDRWFFN